MVINPSIWIRIRTVRIIRIPTVAWMTIPTIPHENPIFTLTMVHTFKILQSCHYSDVADIWIIWVCLKMGYTQHFMVSNCFKHHFPPKRCCHFGAINTSEVTTRAGNLSSTTRWHPYWASTSMAPQPPRAQAYGSILGWFLGLLSSHHFPIFDILYIYIFFLAPFGQIQMVVVFFLCFLWTCLINFDMCSLDVSWPQGRSCRFHPYTKASNRHHFFPMAPQKGNGVTKKSWVMISAKEMWPCNWAVFKIPVDDNY